MRSEKKAEKKGHCLFRGPPPGRRLHPLKLPSPRQPDFHGAPGTLPLSIEFLTDVSPTRRRGGVLSRNFRIVSRERRVTEAAAAGEFEDSRTIDKALGVSSATNCLSGRRVEIAAANRMLRGQQQIFRRASHRESSPSVFSGYFALSTKRESLVSTRMRSPVLR